jgi:HD-GYP domain-containing protein (c-di-GMP phosphodiesterase class II)
MLYALPPGWAPPIVAAGWIVGKLPAYMRGTRCPDRAVVAVANSWHAVGPAVVFALAGIVTPQWSDWALLLAAFCAQLGCDLAASIAREWLRLGEMPKLAVRLLGPVYLTDLCLSPIGLAVAFGAAGHPAAALITLPLSGLLMFFARDRRARMEATVELSRAYRGTALLLGDFVEADDAYTGSHSRDVVELAMGVGQKAGLDQDQLRRLEFAALLHDVGKIAIPNEIINKPGKLDEQEWARVKMHTIEGQRMLETVGGLMRSVGRIVRSSHERWDGAGYPDGLCDEEIPLESRIVSACDAFDAMTTTRSYRKGMPVDVAVAELIANSGTQFDPAVVAAVLDVLQRPSASSAPPPSDSAAISVPALG